jgi:hypothetical protein
LRSELQTSVANIRQGLAGDGKHEGESSLAVAKLARVICVDDRGIDR